MSDLFGVRRVVTVVGLIFTWCVLWGELSLANLASGAAVSVLIVASGVGTAGRGGVRLVPLVHFAGLVMLDLAASTVSVAREILTPTDYTDEAIVAVRMPAEAREHLLMLVVAVTVTPGTAVVDADPETSTLYLHLLHADRSDDVAAHVVQLADLACRALPVDAGVARKDVT